MPSGFVLVGHKKKIIIIIIIIIIITFPIVSNLNMRTFYYPPYCEVFILLYVFYPPFAR